jgi:hypothetical protein
MSIKAIRVEIPASMILRKKLLRVKWRDAVEHGLRYYETIQKSKGENKNER